MWAAQLYPALSRQGNEDGNDASPWARSCVGVTLSRMPDTADETLISKGRMWGKSSASFVPHIESNSVGTGSVARK